MASEPNAVTPRGNGRLGEYETSVAGATRVSYCSSRIAMYESCVAPATKHLYRRLDRGRSRSSDLGARPAGEVSCFSLTSGAYVSFRRQRRRTTRPNPAVNQRRRKPVLSGKG